MLGGKMFEALTEVPFEQAITVAHIAARCLAHGKDLTAPNAELSPAEQSLASKIKAEIEAAEGSPLGKISIDRAERYIPKLEETIARIVRQRPGFDPERGKRLLAEMLKDQMQEAPQSEPDPAAKGIFERGVELFNSGDHVGAERVFRKALEVEPGFIAVLHNSFVRSFGEARDWRWAILVMRFVLRLDPSYTPAKDGLTVAFLNYGYEEAQRGNLESAIDKYSLALALDANPDLISKLRANTAAAYTGLGLRSLEAGDLFNSWTSMLHACNFQPNENTRHNLGLAYARYGLWLLEKKGQFDEAVEFFEMAQDVGLRDSWLLSNHGAALAAIGRLHEAIAKFEKALELAPDDSTIVDNLSRARAQVGSHQTGTVELFRTEEASGQYYELSLSSGRYAIAPVPIVNPEFLPAA
jgi:tetratricopeptide (TPR) repeat protein